MATHTVTLTADFSAPGWIDPLTTRPAKDKRLAEMFQEWLQTMSDTVETGIGTVRVADVRRQR